MAWSKGASVFTAERAKLNSWHMAVGTVTKVGRTWVYFKYDGGSGHEYRFAMEETETASPGYVDHGPYLSSDVRAFPTAEARDEYVAVSRYWRALQAHLRHAYSPPEGVTSADLRPLLEKLDAAS